MKLEPLQLITGISLVLGIILLLVSSLFVDAATHIDDICGNEFVACGLFRWYLAAGAFGIIASLLQITAFPLAYFEKWRLWFILHFSIFVIVLTAYIIVLEKNVNAISTAGNDKGFPSRAKAFISFTAIDFTYSILATGAAHYFRNQ